VVNTELFLDELLLPQWFCCVGQGKIIKEPTGEVIKVSESLDDAISVWENDFENRCDAWEELRLKLLSNQTWENDFHILRNNTWDILKNNIFFVNFAKEVKKRTQLDPEFFFFSITYLRKMG